MGVNYLKGLENGRLRGRVAQEQRKGNAVMQEKVSAILEWIRSNALVLDREGNVVVVGYVVSSRAAL